MLEVQGARSRRQAPRSIRVRLEHDPGSPRRSAIIRRRIRSTSVEQVRAALLGDDLPEQRPQQAHLATERVAGAREPEARGSAATAGNRAAPDRRSVGPADGRGALGAIAR